MRPRSVRKDSAQDKIDYALIRQLAAIARETDLSEVEISNRATRIKVGRTPGSGPSPIILPGAVSDDSKASPPDVPDNDEGEHVLSFMVGIVHLTNKNMNLPYAIEGQQISKDQTIAVVDVIGTIHPIKSPRNAIFHEYLIAEGDAVDYGAPVAVVK